MKLHNRPANVDYTQFDARLAELRAMDLSYDPEEADASWETIQKYMDIFSEARNNGGEQPVFTDEQKAEYKAAFNSKHHSNRALAEELARLEEVADTQLVKIETRYVITDEPLISPAGFPYDSKVFVQNTVMIHSDSLAIRAPKTNGGELKAYEINPQ